MRELVAEVFGVFGGAEVVLFSAPIGNGVDDAADQLAHAGFALRRADLAVKIFADDDVGGGLGPIRGDLDVALLEDDGSLIVANGGGAQLPGDFVVRVYARGKVAREVHADSFRDRHRPTYVFKLHRNAYT